MPNMKRTQLLFLLTAVVLFFSCTSNDKDNIKTYLKTKKKALFADLNLAPQPLTVQAGRDTTVFGADSTLLHFYPNSFKDAAGNVIPSGTIEIELVEMYKPGEMVLNGATTATGNAELLKSGGQVKIKVTKEGKEVFANKYAIGFRSLNGTNEKMSLFYGNTNNEDSVVTWNESYPENDSNRAAGTVTDTGTGFSFFGGFYYLFAGCTQFNLVNCDRLFKSNRENTTAKVVLPDDSYVPGNTQVYIILPETNSATMGDFRQEFDAKTRTFTVGNHGNLVPVGMKYVMVVIASKDGKYYFDMREGTITQGLTVNMSPYLETRFNIRARLAGIM
jgi:hypothetical protein